jgi:aminopeptidase N
MDIQKNKDVKDDLLDPQSGERSPTLILRKDYEPYPWLVNEVQLDFDLGLDITRVLSKLVVRRNPSAAKDNKIKLDGGDLRLLFVKVDGESVENFVLENDNLVIPLAGDSHTIEIATEVSPSKNTKLEGLYASNGMLCTQCEAEGFRNITFFPDRPDVLAIFQVQLTAPKEFFPVLLCNGNLLKKGDSGDGNHWAIWHDPWPKPSYLFALVAGDLKANSSTFNTMSGREVEINVWVRPEDLARTDHAVESLKKSMKWDEETFGREYDLDLYNIVAVSDFNMGAMENKGLNIFNTKYVLADAETATDADFDAIEGVIAHEYFHNWSGNRVTCRDWFQLSLKEGFTVLRDQLFSQDMQGESVKRIEDVRILRAAQFPEDSGPLAHPIRPNSYSEISNFYTATIYNKGAEVIRMMRTLSGVDRFREGTDLYFERHDGEAATCEDFVKAIEDGAGLDLNQFRLWYSQAGTPSVKVETRYERGEFFVRLSQTVPSTPGQTDKQAMVIPLRIALVEADSKSHRGEELLLLDKPQKEFQFSGFSSKPALSINRNFTAPVVIERDASLDELLLLAAYDDDSFARFEAMQEMMLKHLVASVSGAITSASRSKGEAAIVKAYKKILTDSTLDDSMRGELMAFPTQTYLFEQFEIADPDAILSEREGLKRKLASELADELIALYEHANGLVAAGNGSRGARKVMNMTLGLMASGDQMTAITTAVKQYDNASNMTERQGALAVLAGLDSPSRETKLSHFYETFKGNALVVDKWFSIQALSSHTDVVKQVKVLAQHPDFTLKNPNRVRSLYMALAANPNAFHTKDGSGYSLISDLILLLDPINPQTAARFVPYLGRWRRIESKRASLMRGQLEKIRKANNLSRDTFEQVSRSLDG